ncbi:MAG: lysylphosphatidylglycerol synthase domain-containing protein [bacterium]
MSLSRTAAQDNNGTALRRRRLREMGWIAAFFMLLGATSTAYWFTRRGGAPPNVFNHPLKWEWLALIPLLTLLSMALRFVRWQYLLRVNGCFVPLRDSAMAYLSGFGLMVTPAYAGEVVRALLLRQWHGTPLRRTVIVIIASRIFDFAAVMFLSGAARAWTNGANGLIPFTAICVLILLMTGRLVAERPHAIGTAAAKHGFIESFMARLRIVMICAFLSVVAWLPAVAAMSAACRAVGLIIPAADAARAFTDGTLAGAATLMPAGIGFTGGAMIISLESSGAPPNAAVVAAFIVRAGTIWFSILVGMATLVLLWLKLLRPRQFQMTHFDDLAPEYTEQIPEHMRGYYLKRKMGIMLDRIPANARMGADLGCGPGWYAIEMARAGRAGRQMAAIDLSRGQLRHALGCATQYRGQIMFCAGDMRRLPLAPEWADFAYSVNAFHHIGHPEMQAEAFHEAARILRPGGLFFLHEMNIANPLFRFYLSYIFPLLKRIDEGNERWLWPDQLPQAGGLRLEEVCYFDFMPDFLPQWLLPAGRALERRLEKTRWRRFSAHYVAIFRKNG